MSRLTERFSNGQAAVLGCGTNCKYDFKYCENYLENCPTIVEILEKLAHYEDLEEPEQNEWIYGIDICDVEFLECPLCHNVFYDGDNDTFDVPYNYCPNCGVKLVWSER